MAYKEELYPANGPKNDVVKNGDEVEDENGDIKLRSELNRVPKDLHNRKASGIYQVHGMKFQIRYSIVFMNQVNYEQISRKMI